MAKAVENPRLLAIIALLHHASYHAGVIVLDPAG